MTEIASGGKEHRADKQLLTMVFAAASIIKRMQVAWSDQECTETHGWCCKCERTNDNPPCPGYAAKTWLQIARRLRNAALTDSDEGNADGVPNASEMRDGLEDELAKDIAQAIDRAERACPGGECESCLVYMCLGHRIANALKQWEREERRNCSANAEDECRSASMSSTSA